MTPHLHKLFEPGRVGKMEIKNRIVLPAMGTNYGTTDGFVTDRMKAYYEERAIGGAGLIITEVACAQYPVGEATLHELRADHDRFIPSLSELARSVTNREARSPCSSIVPVWKPRHSYPGVSRWPISHSRLAASGIETTDAGGNPGDRGLVCPGCQKSPGGGI